MSTDAQVEPSYAYRYCFLPTARDDHSSIISHVSSLNIPSFAFAFIDGGVIYRVAATDMVQLPYDGNVHYLPTDPGHGYGGGYGMYIMDVDDLVEVQWQTL